MAGTGKASTPRQRLLGERVRERRGELGLTQEEFAERVAMHPTYISLVERGLRNPSLENVCRIARALGVNAGLVMWDLDKVEGRAALGGRPAGASRRASPPARPRRGPHGGG